MRLRSAILPAIAILGIAGSALPAYAGDITVTGVGEVAAAPDMAQINSGVTTQGATAREALDANSAAMNELIAALKEAGIESRDIQTSQFSVRPNYVHTDQRDDDGYTLPPRINGYQVSNSVTVRVRDLGALGDILDHSVEVGANTINGISFSVADPEELYNEARRLAVEDARAKAELYAEATGVRLEELESLSERQEVSPPQPYAMRAMEQSGSVPVEGGELGFAINVSVTWETSDD